MEINQGICENLLNSIILVSISSGLNEIFKKYFKAV